ncbi:MAG: hypothetical protein ABI769_03580 [Pseudomonadota bacterium]
MADAMHQKANPIAVVAISIYIPAFLALVIFAQQSPENWFVKHFLGGVGLAVAAVLLFGATTVVVSLVERRLKSRNAGDRQGSPTK